MNVPMIFRRKQPETLAEKFARLANEAMRRTDLWRHHNPLPNFFYPPSPILLSYMPFAVRHFGHRTTRGPHQSLSCPYPRALYRAHELR